VNFKYFGANSEADEHRAKMAETTTKDGSLRCETQKVKRQDLL
jgi:hypothetical protein